MSESRLVRAVGRWDLTALAINGLIGAGIFGLPADAARLTGPWSPLACLLCAAVVLFIVLCFAEVSSLFVGTGGPYLYAREAFGDPLGLVAGWMMWLARATAFAANINLMISFLGYFTPGARAAPARAVIIVAVVSFLTAINIRGVRLGALVGDVLAATKLAPMFVFVLSGLFFVDRQMFDLGFRPSRADFGQAMLLYVFAFTGFEFAAIVAGEALAPRKDLPGAMLTALAIATVLYTGIQTVCVGTLPNLANSRTAMADASARFLGSLGGKVIAATALVSIAGNLSGMALISPRLTYVLGEDGLLPSALAATHARFRTPYVSILLYGLVTATLALSGSFVVLVRISAVARIAPYILTCLSLPVLRRKYPDVRDRFRLEGGVAIPAVAVALCTWLLFQSQWEDILAAGIALAAGFLLYALSSPLRRKDAKNR